jgi:hypothetical protein
LTKITFPDDPPEPENPDGLMRLWAISATLVENVSQRRVQSFRAAGMEDKVATFLRVGCKFRA